MPHLQNKPKFMTTNERKNRPVKGHQSRSKKKLPRKLLVRQEKQEKENKSSRNRLTLNERFSLLEVTDDLKKLCPGVKRKYSTYRPMTDAIYTRWERQAQSLKLQSSDIDNNRANLSPLDIDTNRPNLYPSDIDTKRPNICLLDTDTDRSNQSPFDNSTNRLNPSRLDTDTNLPNPTPFDNNTNRLNPSRLNIDTNLPNLSPLDIDTNLPNSSPFDDNTNRLNPSRLDIDTNLPNLSPLDIDTNLPNLSPFDNNTNRLNQSRLNIDTNLPNLCPLDIDTNQLNQSPFDMNTNQSNQPPFDINTKRPNLCPLYIDSNRPKSKVVSSSNSSLEVMKLPICSAYTIYPPIGSNKISAGVTSTPTRNSNKRSASTSHIGTNNLASRRSVSTSNIDKDSACRRNWSAQKGANTRKARSRDLTVNRCHSVYPNFIFEERSRSPVSFGLCPRVTTPGTYMRFDKKKAWNRHETKFRATKPTTKGLLFKKANLSILSETFVQDWKNESVSKSVHPNIMNRKRTPKISSWNCS